MKRPILKLFGLSLLPVFFNALNLQAASPLTLHPLQMAEVFSSADHPGEGKLEFKVGDSAQSIEFGAQKGHYGLGIVFTAKVLPDSFRKTLGANKQVIQIALGNLDIKTEPLIPHFAAFSLVVNRIPTLQPISLKVFAPQKNKKRPEEAAVFLISAPSMKVPDADEDKLKATYFAEEGKITVAPVGQPERVVLKSEGRNLQFKRQSLVLNIDSTLVSPFNSTAGSLKGTLTIPVYWPDGKESDLLATRLASESLEKAPSLSPEAQAAREVASPPPVTPHQHQ